jgi:hypothetical protein
MDKKIQIIIYIFKKKNVKTKNKKYKKKFHLDFLIDVQNDMMKLDHLFFLIYILFIIFIIFFF